MAVRVLIVDDSIFIRKRLAEMLAGEPDITVVGQAANGIQAVRMVSQLQPDVVTMDIEMPELNGIEAVKIVMRENPTPILMFSVATQQGARATLDALEAGAMDFLPKQLDQINSTRDNARSLLCSRIRTLGQSASTMRRTLYRQAMNIKKNDLPRRTAGEKSATPSMLLIAASTGGPIAIQKIVSRIPKNWAIPVLIVQHMPAEFTASFAERLNRQANIEVREAKHGDTLKPGLALLAPGGCQLELESGAVFHSIRIRASDPHEYFQPCADVTFASVAQHVDRHVLAVVLTGMGADGKIGAQKLKAKGASIWAQNEESCTVYGMPKAVIDADLADRVMDIDGIANGVSRL